MKRLLLALLLLLSAPALAPLFSAAAAPVAGSFADPALETRARHLQRQLRCLQCQGESIDESGADFAADARKELRRQIAAGRSDAQILDFFHDRYGDFILMQPPVEPATWLLWLVPFLVLGGAGSVGWLVLARAKRAAKSVGSDDIANY